MEFEIDSNNIIEMLEKVEIPKKKTHLDVSKNVKKFFKVKCDAPIGKHIIKGTCTYFYCSKKESWCSRFTYPFEINLEVVKKIK